MNETVRYQRRHLDLPLEGGTRRQRRHRARIVRVLRQRFSPQSALTRARTAAEASARRGRHIEAIRVERMAEGFDVSRGWTKRLEV